MNFDALSDIQKVRIWAVEQSIKSGASTPDVIVGLAAMLGNWVLTSNTGMHEDATAWRYDCPLLPEADNGATTKDATP